MHRSLPAARAAAAACLLISLILSGSLCAPGAVAAGETSTKGQPSPEAAQAFLTQNCRDCHSPDYAEGGFDVDELLAAERQGTVDLDRWVRIWDRVSEGEMPPSEDEGGHAIAAGALRDFLDDAGNWVTLRQRAEAKERGRVQERRLTTKQLERTLQNLLGIDIPLAVMLPEDRRTDGFTTVADGQSISHFDLQNHLDVVDAALDEFFARLTYHDDTFSKELPPEVLAYRRKGRRGRMPELLDGKAVVWSVRTPFVGQIPPTQAHTPGWYRITFDASAMNAPDYGVWCTVRTGRCQSSEPILTDIGVFRATPEKKTYTFEAWLPDDHMFEIRPADARLKTGSVRGGNIGVGEIGPQNVPGLVLHHATFEKFYRGASREQLREHGIVPFKVKYEKTKSKDRSEHYRIESDNPKRDIAVFLRRFADRAFRRPADTETLAPYLTASQQQIDDGVPLIDVLRDAMRAVLCSPRFLYHVESPGELDDYALASRLSYFLTGTLPDPELWQAAKDGNLSKPYMLHRQTERLLAGEGASRFVEQFAHEWLDLSEIDFTDPERKTTPDFDLVVQNAMVAETRTFLTRMIAEDWPAGTVADSRTVHLNERLAAHYRFNPDREPGSRPVYKKRNDEPGYDPEADRLPLLAELPSLKVTTFDKAELRAVTIPDDHPRGGLLTQGAILKVTANGTNTSPVLRGVWVCEKLLGMHVPPPPSNVPAVEPDIRGAKTIRDQLALHESDPSCASCHKKIDPAGYALEAFDPAGRFRTNYVMQRRGKLLEAAAIDGSNTLPESLGIEDGTFADVVELQQKLAANPRPLARNFVSQLLTYATGGRPGFAERDALDAIVTQAADNDYGMKSLLHAAVQSEIFRTK